MTILKHDDHVRLEGWEGISVKVGTARGYAASYNGDQEEAHQRAVKNGHNTAWTVYTGTALYGDRAYGALKAAERMENFIKAILLADGQVVEIEGERFTVKVIRRNEKYPVNSDPIHFIKVI